MGGTPGGEKFANSKLNAEDTKRQADETTRLIARDESDDTVNLVKKPVMFLSYSLILYLLIGELGLGLVLAKAIFSLPSVGWWVVFTPLWLATLISLALMVLSVHAVWGLSATARSMGEYTPLPLLVARFVLVAELILIPVESMLLWSTILFCMALESVSGELCLFYILLILI